MGLDMHAIARSSRLPAEVDFAEAPDDQELFY